MLSYLQFLLVFLVPPILLLSVLAAVRRDTWWGLRPLSGIVVIVVLAFVYTTPWDNILIAEGVWWYGEGATAVHFWEAPLGEYLFFVLQPVVTGLWLFQSPKIADVSMDIPVRQRLLGVVAGFAVSGVGYLLLGGATFYAGAILLWSGPILAIQWGFGWPYLWKIRRTVALAVAVPTCYFWAIDWYAIDTGLWVLSGSHTTGLAIVGLPVEEALFFLLTNTFAVQGLVMYMWLFDRVDRGMLQEWTPPVLGRQPSPDVEQ
jgi:lycopene cyclase domain-containing protein